MPKEIFPGSEYLERSTRFVQEQIEYWTEVRGVIDQAARKIRDPKEPYDIKHWLGDVLELWGTSLTAAESAWLGLLGIAADERTPTLSFTVKSETNGAPAKCVRVGATDAGTLQAILEPMGGPVDGKPSGAEQALRLDALRRGLLRVKIVNWDREACPPGQYLGIARNSDVALAVLHVMVEP